MADQVAAGHGADEAAGEGAEEGGDFGVVLQVLGGCGARLGVVGHQREVFGALGVGHRAADDVQAVGDQGAFGLEQRQPERVGVGRVHVDRVGLLRDQLGEVGAVGGVRRQGAPAVEAVLQVHEALVEAGLRQRRGQVADGDGVERRLASVASDGLLAA